jgi:hypothetical protein
LTADILRALTECPGIDYWSIPVGERDDDGYIDFTDRDAEGKITALRIAPCEEVPDIPAQFTIDHGVIVNGITRILNGSFYARHDLLGIILSDVLTGEALRIPEDEDALDLIVQAGLFVNHKEAVFG